MLSLDAPFLLSASLKDVENVDSGKFPFCLKAVQAFGQISFHPNVTFFIGENGSGKSTLVEALAIACGFNAEGGSKNFGFVTRQSHSLLWKHVRLVRSHRRPADGYFLRAETFYNVATEIDILDEEPLGGPPVIDSYGGTSLHRQSHGESFLSLFLKRFRGKGLYILDEPEAALSPMRQLAMLERLHQLVKLGSQFIIATHSPMLLAYPNSTIFEISGEGRKTVAYKESEHFITMRNFLNHHENIIRTLIED